MKNTLIILPKIEALILFINVKTVAVILFITRNRLPRKPFHPIVGAKDSENQKKSKRDPIPINAHESKLKISLFSLILNNEKIFSLVVLFFLNSTSAIAL